MGAAVGDDDNDGRPDLYVTNFGVSRLYHNNGDGTFTDVAEKLGVARKGWSTGATWGDYDGDGRLDLFVPGYVEIDLDNLPRSPSEASKPSGVGLNENGREQAGMGVAIGDYDNSGRISFQVTNFSDDSNVLYHNDGDSNFTDVTYLAGLGEITLPFLGWGTSFLDYDNDGWLDLIVANGHVYPVVDNNQWGTSYAQQPLLFRNLNNGKFERVGAEPGSGLAYVLGGRGLAGADLHC